jgi:hypothetical protein
MHAGVVAGVLGPGTPESTDAALTMNARFRQALAANPADRNAAYLWDLARANRAAQMAAYYGRTGRDDERRQQLELAATLAPESLEGAEAQFFLKQMDAAAEDEPE